MKNLPKFIASIALCELVGLSATPFTIQAIPTWYATLTKPSFSPPNWLFGPAWTLLYALMGISFYLIWRKGWGKKKVREAATYFFVQLLFNFLWSIFFFSLRSPILALLDIVLLLIAILLAMKHFYPLSKPAFYLLIPYLLWVSFATILNLAIIILN